MSCDELNDAYEACGTLMSYLACKSDDPGYDRLYDELLQLKKDILDETPTTANSWRLKTDDCPYPATRIPLQKHCTEILPILWASVRRLRTTPDPRPQAMQAHSSRKAKSQGGWPTMRKHDLPRYRLYRITFENGQLRTVAACSHSSARREAFSRFGWTVRSVQVEPVDSPRLKELLEIQP